MDNDQFGSIVKQCLPNSFQQEKLRTCPFAREFENFPDAECSDMDQTPEQVTPIIMVSIPETSNEDNNNTPLQEDELFQTASEHSQSQLADREVNRVRDEIMEIDVDLGKESHNLEIDVDLGNKCDSLVFLPQKSPPQGALPEVNGGGELSYVGQCKVKGFEGFEVESSPLKDLRVSDETSREMRTDTELIAEGENEGPELGLVGGLNVVTPTQCVCENDGKKIEDLDKLKYGHSGSVDQCADEKHVGKKCELPFSTRKNVGGTNNGSSAKNGVLSGIFQVLQRVVTDLDKGDGDPDFLEAAKRRGMTFPRPRWWPPEGFDD